MRLIETIRTPKGDILYEESEILKKAQNFKSRKFIFKQWDMYWAAVRFTDDLRFFKVRPIILVKQLGSSSFKILCCSHINKEGRYPLRNYLTLGLKDPTFVVSKPEIIELKYIFDSLKKPLSFEDRKNMLLLGI